MNLINIHADISVSDETKIQTYDWLEVMQHSLFKLFLEVVQSISIIVQLPSHHGIQIQLKLRHLNVIRILIAYLMRPTRLYLP